MKFGGLLHLEIQDIFPDLVHIPRVKISSFVLAFFFPPENGTELLVLVYRQVAVW